MFPCAPSQILHVSARLDSYSVYSVYSVVEKSRRFSATYSAIDFLDIVRMHPFYQGAQYLMNGPCRKSFIFRPGAHYSNESRGEGFPISQTPKIHALWYNSAVNRKNENST